MTRPDSNREWPTIYDIHTDSNRAVTQEDINILQLRGQISYHIKQIMALLIRRPRSDPQGELDRLCNIVKFIEKYDEEKHNGPVRPDGVRADFRSE